MAVLNLDFDDETAPPPAPVYAPPPAIGLARARLKPPARRQSVWRLVGAATFAAVSALGLAAMVIVGPPIPRGAPTQVDVNPYVR